MVCDKFNVTGPDCFRMGAMDFFVYLNYCVADAKERARREREAMAKIRR